MSDDHLAGRAVGHITVLVVDHADIQPRHRPSEHARAHLARRLVVEGGAHHLGHAPDLDQREAEALLELRMPLRVDAGADGKAHAVAAVQRRRRLAQQHRHHHAQVVHDGGARLVHLGPPARGAEAVGLHLAVAAQHHAVEGEDRRVDVEQRQRVVEPVGAVAEAGQPTGAGIPAAGLQLVAVRQHATLGPAGGTRGVEHAGGRVRRGCVGTGRLPRPGQRGFKAHHRRPVRRGFEGRLKQRLQFVGNDHQIDLRMLQHIGHLARAVVGIQRHAADAQRVHRQLVQQMFGPVLQQQGDAVAQAVAGIGIGLHQRAHRLCCGGIAQLVAGRVVAARRVGRHGQEGVVAEGVGALPGRCRRWWRRGQERSPQSLNTP